MDLSLKWTDGWMGPLAWCAAGLGSCAVWFVLTFPYEALQARVIGEVQQHSGFDVRSTQSVVRFPATLEWRNVTVSNQEWGAVQLAVVQARVAFLKALTGELGVDVLIQADETTPASGLVKGTVAGSSWAWTGPVSVKGQFQQIDLPTFVRRYVSRGTLNGEFLQHIVSAPGGGAAMKGDGIWKAEAKDLTVDQIPLSNGLTLSMGFARVAAAVSCRDTVCDVTELKGDGPDGSFSGTGKITVQQPVQNSQLALTMTLVPGAGFAAKGVALGLPPLPAGVPLTVKVLGTLGQARLAL